MSEPIDKESCIKIHQNNQQSKTKIQTDQTDYHLGNHIIIVGLGISVINSFFFLSSLIGLGGESIELRWHFLIGQKSNENLY